MSSHAALRSSSTTESRLQAGRLLTGWRREPVVLVQSLIFPTFLLIVYKLVIGESILNLTGDDSLHGPGADVRCHRRTVRRDGHRRRHSRRA
jgi:hypothetical protein